MCYARALKFPPIADVRNKPKQTLRVRVSPLNMQIESTKIEPKIVPKSKPNCTVETENELEFDPENKIETAP